jgi:ABC-type lipoprotein release transport system permease subunit
LETERGQIEDHARNFKKYSRRLLSMSGQVKVTSDGIDENGRPIHVEWSGKFDGKDYPVTGNPNSETRSYTKLNERTLTTTNKKNGKVTVAGQVVVSTDGKSRTVTVTGTSPDGKKFKNIAVYDRQ